jgi:SHS2 domain-containing protein
VLTPGYRFLPHTTDAYIESVGATFEEALENAGLALFDTMCNLESITHAQQDTIAADGTDDLGLLYDWLESLLLKFELEQKVYSKFQVSLTQRPQGPRLTAQAYGEIFDRKRHGAKVEVKAVTYHRMEISRQGGMVVLRFILDL